MGLRVNGSAGWGQLCAAAARPTRHVEETAGAPRVMSFDCVGRSAVIAPRGAHLPANYPANVVSY